MSDHEMAFVRRVALLLLLAACGDNKMVFDATPPDAGPTPRLGPVIELGLLPPRGAATFAHSLEVSLAATADQIVAAYINLADDDPSTYSLEGEAGKRVAIATSLDRGESFSAPYDPETVGSAPFSTDPVVRNGADGMLWFATLGQTSTGLDFVSLAKSQNGLTWQPIAMLDALDKEWIAVDSTSVWIGFLGRPPTNLGYYRLDFDGNILGQAIPLFNSGIVGMYADTAGIHMAHITEANAAPVVQWSGSSPPQQEGELLPNGRDNAESVFPYVTTMSLGSTVDGGQWVVRAAKRDGFPAIVLRVRRLPDEGIDIPISEPNAHAFLPTALVDDDGRLRVIYYDTAGPRGLLLTTRSKSKDWSLGFEPSTVIDRDVCPGERWVPTFDTPGGGRRLREYIDAVKTRRRIHVAWTASLNSPSRVRTAYFDY